MRQIDKTKTEEEKTHSPEFGEECSLALGVCPSHRKPARHRSGAGPRLGLCGLGGKLSDEVAGNSTTGPRIIEEEQFGKRIHVTVIWEAWKDMPPEDRGWAIMDAYERARPDDVLHITIPGYPRARFNVVLAFPALF